MRALPIAVRPRHGETVESCIRRLARANHLRPSYLRRYLAGRPGLSAVRPERLVGLSGRTADTLTRALADFDATPRRPQRTDRLRRRHSDKPALYRAIRAALAAEPDTSVKSLFTRFRVGARTVALAIASPEPPPWKPPNKEIPARSPRNHTIIAYRRAVDDHLPAANWSKRFTGLVGRSSAPSGSA
ncbi:TniQ family protein [Dactylosporangium sp. NPDC000244]|uniref:TniQ family protein n=1 Tax=Dactylosporangium sp. NPDC000244 TaxID=3154365 RepID=UPI0033291C2E